VWWLFFRLAIAAPTISAEGARVELETGAVVTADTAQVTADGVVEATTVRAVDDAQSITIRADHTRWNLNTKTSEMTGSVHAKQGDISVSCDKASLEYSSDKTVRRAVASGQVVVTRGGYRATGEQAVLEEGRITLTGNAKLSDGRSLMTGTRIVFVVGDEAVECDGCTMTVPPGPGGSR
jgi:lipopolysaccharide transport protein LptA